MYLQHFGLHHPPLGKETTELRFVALIGHALKTAGCAHTLIADSGMEILRQGSKGLPRQAGRILRNALRLAVPRGLNHLPDEVLQQALAEMP